MPRNLTPASRAKAIAERTSDAYSTDRYTSWAACARVLVDRGLNDLEVEAVLRSKVTRWAADMSDKPYGRANSKDLVRFIATGRDRLSPEFIAELVAGTFPTGGAL